MKGGESGRMKRIMFSLILVFALGRFVYYTSFAETRFFTYSTQQDSSLADELVQRISFYACTICTEKTVNIFGFYGGPISPNNKRINLVLSAEGKLQVREAECASSYENEPFCPPMLFLPKVRLQETPTLGEKVISDETVSFFRGNKVEIVNFGSKLPYLDFQRFVLTIVPKSRLAELKEATYTTLSPQKRAELDALLDFNNRICKSWIQDVSLPDKPRPDIWGLNWPLIPTDPRELFMSMKNQTGVDLQKFFKQGNVLSKFPDRSFRIIVYFSEFGSDGEADYRSILEIPPFEIRDLNVIPKLIEENFGASMKMQ